MNAVVEWVQRIAAGHRSRPPASFTAESADAAERDLPAPDWTWIAMFPGELPVGMMELLVRSGRRDEIDRSEPRA